MTPLPGSPAPAAPAASFDPYWLGTALLQAGQITRPQLDSAIAHYKRNGGPSFEAVLEFLSLADQYTLAAHIARRHGLRLVTISPGSLSAAIASLLPAHRARTCLALPVEASPARVTVAVADPRAYTPRDAERDFPGRNAELVVAPRSDILTSLELALSRTGAEAVTPRDRFAAILTEAVRRRANDVHLEAQPNALVVRFRIDNDLVHQDHLEPSWKDALIRAAKTFARIDLAERRLPQDGQGHHTIGAQRYTCRINTVPTYYGEDATIRLQAEGSRLLGLVDLGLSAETIAIFRRIMARPFGMLYITGPTGSGKTTLLHSLLASDSTADEKIITIEDPVEIVVPAYRQIAIDESIGRTFPTVMRAIVRHDPDRILLGETRDLESARIAVQAALTGHKVYSTLHTNDAPSAIPRLMDIGVEPYLIAAALNGIAACRLVRRLCRDCRQPVGGERADIYRRDFGDGHYFSAHGPGCPRCTRGYHGRLALCEAYPVDHDEVQSLILRRTPVHLLRQEFRRLLGLPDLRQDGLTKARQGLTTVEEVLAQA